MDNAPDWLVPAEDPPKKTIKKAEIRNDKGQFQKGASGNPLGRAAPGAKAKAADKKAEKAAINPFKLDVDIKEGKTVNQILERNRASLTVALLRKATEDKELAKTLITRLIPINNAKTESDIVFDDLSEMSVDEILAANQEIEDSM